MQQFIITDMSCKNCKAKIDAVLIENNIQGTINIETKMLTVENTNGLTEEAIINIIASAGYTAKIFKQDLEEKQNTEVSLASAQYQIPDITCTNCTLIVTKQLEKNGISAVINAGTKQMQITDNPNQISTDGIVSEVKKAGYTAIPIEKEKNNNQKQEETTKQLHLGHNHDHDEMFAKKGIWYKREEFKLFWSISAFILAELPMVFHTFLRIDLSGLAILVNPWFQLILTTLTMWLVGITFFKGAINAFKNKVTTMDTLVTVGSFAAYGFSIMQMIVYQFDANQHYFFEATIAILALIYLGHYLEEKATKRTNTALKELTQLHAEVAHVINDAGQITKKPSEVKVGEVVVVYRGEKIPLDGIIISGQGSINEAMITGEPVPTFKTEGVRVIGGTALESGELQVRVLKDESQGTLSSIIESVEKAQFEKPAIQKTADKISSVFVPAILVIALFTFVIYFFLLQRDFWFSISTTLAVIIISCPCAFGLATPLSILNGSSLAAKRGILYKSGATFEQIKRIDAICFDKTGTLTKGTPNVVATFASLEKHAGILYQAEQKSEHPLALAIVRFIEENEFSIPGHLKLQVEEESGKGIFVRNNEGVYAIGSLKLTIQEGVILTKAQEDFVNEHTNQGASIVVVIENSVLVNILAIRDTVKPEVRELLSKLHNQGIQTYMVTGDMKKPAEAIADEIGLDKNHVFSEVHPVDKLEYIKKLQADGLTVAFVGDGINDAPALAQADLGIAVGTGAKVALSAADITLVGGNMMLIDDALQISKATLRNIYTNFGWAFSYNVIAIPIAVLGLLTPTLAAAFMAFSDIVVVLNAATLKLFRKK